MINKGKYLLTRITTQNIFKSSHFIILLLIFGFVFRFLLIRFRFAVAFDEVNYLKLGISGHLNGISNVLHTYWSPLLPTLISFACSIFENYEFAGRIVSILAGTFLVIPVYYLGRYIYSHYVGLIAAAFIAFFPPLAFQSTQILTEPVYMLIAAIAILISLKSFEHASVVLSLSAGLLTGLLYLMHPQGVGFIIVILFWIVFGSIFKIFSLRSQKAFWLSMSLGLGFMIAASPYLIYLKKVTDTWTLSAKFNANQQFEAETTDESQDPFRALDIENKTVAFDRIFHEGNFLQSTNGNTKSVRDWRLTDFLLKYTKNVYYMLKSSIPAFFTTIPMILFGIGLLGSPWVLQQGNKILYLLSFIVFFWFIMIPSFHITERYISPLWPICTIWIANGVINIYKWLSCHTSLNKLTFRHKFQQKKIASILILAFIVIFTFIPEIGRIILNNPYSNDYWAPPIEQKIAGLWLKENFPGPKIIMSRFQTVDIYAGNYNVRESITIPDNELDRVLSYARIRGVNYLVLNERYKKDIKKIAYLFDTNEDLSGLERIYKKRDATGFLTLIYRII